MSIKLGVPSVEGAQPRIAIVGVGGGGCNGVNSMMKGGMPGVSFIACDTDGQHLAQTEADWRIHLGKDTTGGYGAGTNPEIGREAAEESVDGIRAALSGASLAFLTGGMGGGTGSGALPVIARLLREMDILTVGVVTKPFNYEGTKRMQVACESIQIGSEHLDTLLVISNQNLFQAESRKITFASALSRVDEVLHESVRGMVDLVVRPGIINMDFADLCMVLRNGGMAVIGVGESTGAGNRATEAALAAATNPLLDGISMDGAKSLLVNVTGGEDLELKDVDDAANLLRGKAHVQARVKVGAAADPDMNGTVRVYVVATGITWRAGGMEFGRHGQRPAPPPADRAALRSRPAKLRPVEAPVQAAANPRAPEAAPASMKLATAPAEARQSPDDGLWNDSLDIDAGSIARPAARKGAGDASRPKPRPAAIVPLGSRVPLGPVGSAITAGAKPGDENPPKPAAREKARVRHPTDTGKGLLSRILSAG